MSDSAFDYGNEGKSNGKEGKLPRHIERMNMGEKKPAMKKSGSSSEGLPWGGDPAEKKKAYNSGLPKNKGSVTGPTGERKSPVGHLGGKGVNMQPSDLPHESHKAHAGHEMKYKSKSMGMNKGKKAK